MTHARNERPHIVLPFKASRLLRYCAGYCEVWSARQEELVRTLDGFAAFHPYRRRGLWGEAEVRYSHSPRSTVNCFLCGFRDRLLLALKRGYPEHFAAVCELKCSPREAGISAGIIKTRPFRCGGVCDSPSRCLADQPMSPKARAVTRMATTTRPLQSLACPESATTRSTQCAGAGVLLKLHKRLPYPDR